MALAACFPSETARITVSGPKAQSPAVNTPSTEVTIVFSSYVKVFHLVHSGTSFSSSMQERSGSCPMAAMIKSNSRSSSLPSTGCGLRLPDSSGSPSSIVITFRPFAFPFSSSTSAGAVSSLKSTPSSIVSSCSCCRAGISSCDLL